MSNQVYKNPVSKYDLANRASALYVFSTSQSIPDAVLTVASNWTLDSDFGLGKDVSLAAGLFTIQRGGVYCVQFSARFAASAVGIREVDILLSRPAATVGKEKVTNAGGSETVQLTSIAIISAEAGDTVRGRVFQNSGGPLDLFGAGADPRTKLLITRIA